jgi:hypothetical protein
LIARRSRMREENAHHPNGLHDSKTGRLAELRGGALKFFQGGAEVVTREPGRAAANVGSRGDFWFNLLKLLIFDTGKDLARRLL